MNKKKKKVLIAMSGGVDSSISAYLLKKKGYDVVGIFIKNWNNKKCNYLKDFIYAKYVSDKLRINLYKIDYSNIYYNKVFKKFIYEYKIGNTPNPDIFCNKYFKFNQLISFSKKIKADYISTGHYIKKIKHNNKYFLLKSIDYNNDQSYFLYNLKNNIIKKCIFPLGELKKKYVRKIAKNLNFINYNKKSSTGICFINNKSFKKFIEKYINNKLGKILTLEEKINLGNHKGLHYYTIGQRKGINIGGKKNFKSDPWFVIKKDIKNNILYVSQNKSINFNIKGLIANNINWIGYNPKSKVIESSVKIRYSKNSILSKIHIINKNFILVFFKKPYGIAVVGQSVVFYIGNYCIGGGIIKKIIY